LQTGQTNTVAAGGGSESANFFNGTSYTNKVLGQMKIGDYHSFPELVRNFAREGRVTEFVGGDKQTYQKLSIPGGYDGRQGNFEFIKNSDGAIQHRLFVPTSR